MGIIQTWKALPKKDLMISGLCVGMFAALSLSLWSLFGMVMNNKTPLVVVLSGSMEPGYYRGDVLFLSRPGNTRATVTMSAFASTMMHSLLSLVPYLSTESVSALVPMPAAPPAKVKEADDSRWYTNYKVGDIVVYSVKNRPVPIVHRILRVHVFDDNATELEQLEFAAVSHDEDGDDSSLEGAAPPVPTPSVNGCKVYFLTKGDNNFNDDRGLYGLGKLWITEDEILGRANGCVPYIGYITLVMIDFPFLRYVLLAGIAGMFLTSSQY